MQRKVRLVVPITEGEHEPEPELEPEEETGGSPMAVDEEPQVSAITLSCSDQVLTFKRLLRAV